MTTKAQLIWDFRGTNALHTAEHHKIHLEEFIALESIKVSELIVTEVSEVYTMVSVIIAMDDVDFLRARLRPHRGKKVPS